LTSLDVGRNNLNEQAALGIVRAARQHDKITNLDLSGCGIGPIGAKEIADYIQFSPVLENLSIANNNIDGEAAQQLARVVLRSASLEVFSEIPIKKLRADALTKLDLRGVGVSGALVLSDLLKFSSALKSCNLLKNGLDVESATMLSKIGAEKGIMLSGMRRDQTKASFSRQGLQPADGILIGSDLQFMAVVTTLDLGGNSIRVEGAKAIAEALKVTAVLTSLDLRSNSIGDDGAKAIAEALKVNAVLTELSLYRNNIGDDGAKAIAEALKVNAVLTTLDLGMTGIWAEGAKAIAEALKVNAVLTTLFLTDNSIGEKGAIAIAEALKVNAVLTKLDIRINRMGYAGEKAVRDAVKDRSGFVLQQF
jgi:Ran GTPase-activating protein (RanGAP) involved in mRNA processing and transport